MDGLILNQVRQDLVRDEGLRLKPYTDTVGKLTIGVGRNLTDNGISEAEAMILLASDVTAAAQDLDRNIPWWGAMSPNRQRALLNMCFNLGWSSLAEFKNMLSALESRRWDVAAHEALNSKWARQVGQRANRIAQLFLEG